MVRRSALAMLVLLGCAGCPDATDDGSETVGSGAEPVAARRPAEPATAPDEAPAADPRPPAPPLTASERAPSPELMHRFARDASALVQSVDPARGLIAVEYFSDASGEDPRADHSGLVRSAHHLCGEQLARELARVQEDLARRVETTSHEPLFRCSGLECRFSAEMEFDRDGVFRFETDEGGTTSLRSIVRIEGGTMTEAFTHRAEEWTGALLRALADRRCDT